ncbi:MAG: hypothetical protein KF869_05675 [Phycisphaeraceae bacterium]|nr:hypothetical protein [Phycisphaeraceae bacterium]
MSSWRAFCETVHAMALGLWLGFVVAAGAYAAAVFPTAKKLAPRLPEFEQYTGDHWLIVGGRIAQTVFLIGDIAQFFCALVAVSTFACAVWMFGGGERRPALYVRGLALAIALASVASLLFVVNPKFVSATNAYWAAARAGDNAAAAAHQQVARETHPYATSLMSLAAGSVAVALGACVWSLATSRGRERGA